VGDVELLQVETAGGARAGYGPGAQPFEVRAEPEMQGAVPIKQEGAPDKDIEAGAPRQDRDAGSATWGESSPPSSSRETCSLKPVLERLVVFEDTQAAM